MNFKFIAQSMGGKDPYSHVLDEGALRDLQSKAKNLGIETQITERTVFWGAGFESKSKRIYELAFLAEHDFFLKTEFNLKQLCRGLKKGFRAERWTPLADDIIEKLRLQNIRADIRDGEIFFKSDDAPGFNAIRERWSSAIFNAYPELPVCIEFIGEQIYMSAKISDIEKLPLMHASEESFQSMGM